MLTHDAVDTTRREQIVEAAGELVELLFKADGRKGVTAHLELVVAWPSVGFGVILPQPYPRDVARIGRILVHAFEWEIDGTGTARPELRAFFTLA